MLPSKRHKRLVQLINICGAACGAGVFRPGFKINILTIFVFFCIGLFFIFSGYTAYVKMEIGFAAALGSLCMVGRGVQGLTKLLGALLKRDKFVEVGQFIQNVYEEYEAKGEKYQQILQESLGRIYLLVKMVMSLYLIAAPVSMVTPLILWLYDGRRVMAMQFLIPGLDPDTTHGYVVILTVQLLFFGFGAFGNFASDLFFFEIIIQFSMLVDVFREKINELNELSVEPNNPKCLESLLDILKWHQTYSKYTGEADFMFFWINFTQVTTAGVSLILILIIIISGDWINSYTYIISEFTLLFIYCGMGTLVELANDDIMTELYAIHWYNLSVSQQKMVKLMLTRSQSAKELSVGGVAPLSVNTGLQVSKTVYSVFMMLLNFFD